MLAHRCEVSGRFVPPWFGTDDPFDPRTWGSDVPYRSIWLDPEAGHAVILDPIDYDHFAQWTWGATPDKHRRKFYATRSTTNDGRPIKIYMHKVITFRAYGPPPTPRHTIGDHCDGHSLDCRRHNLRWATPGMNRANYYGAYAKQLRLEL